MRETSGIPGKKHRYSLFSTQGKEKEKETERDCSWIKSGQEEDGGWKYLWRGNKYEGHELSIRCPFRLHKPPLPQNWPRAICLPVVAQGCSQKVAFQPQTSPPGPGFKGSVTRGLPVYRPWTPHHRLIGTSAAVCTRSTVELFLAGDSLALVFGTTRATMSYHSVLRGTSIRS